MYCHAWSAEDTDQVTCNCKLVTKDLVDQSGGTWLLLHENINLTVSETQHKYRLCDLRQPQWNTNNDLIVDSFIHKKNAIVMALETCINIMSVGLIVYKK